MIEVGLQLPSWAPPGEAVDPAHMWDTAEWAEAHGFDALWAGDHIFWRTPLVESIVTLAGVASRTSRIKLGTSVLLLALRNPAVIAKQVGSLAYLTSDRLVLGVGIGGEYPPEWDACGVPLAERAPRTEHAIRALRYLFGDRGVEVDAALRHLRLDPAPAQPVPIVLGGRHEAALRRAGRMADGWLGIWMGPERVAQARKHIDTARREVLRDHLPFTYGMVLSVLVDDGPSPKARAAELLSTVYGIPGERFERYVLAGSVDDVVERIVEYADLGCHRFVLGPLEQLGIEDRGTLADELLPAIRRALG